MSNKKAPAREEMYDEKKDKNKDFTVDKQKSELGSLQKDEKTTKSQGGYAEHLDASLEDGEYGKHGMKAHMGRAVSHMKKECE